jgi:hypothetical protein
MCCGNGDSSGSPMEPVANGAQRADPDQVYVVTYFNGVTEEAVGLSATQQLLISPAARVEGARTEDDFPMGVVLGGTYAPKV